MPDSTLGMGPGNARTPGTPLTQEEIKTVERLFSDPLAIPPEFKNWLIAFLEANPPTITLSSIFGIGGVIPAGVVWAYAGTTIPQDWLVCNGQTVSTLDYPNLFKALGYFYGGSGNSFVVPDLRGRVIIGVGTHGQTAFGTTEGQPLADRHSRHHHYPQFGVVNAGGGGGFPAGGGSPNYPVTQVRVGYTGPATEDTPAYIALNYIIKT